MDLINFKNLTRYIMQRDNNIPRNQEISYEIKRKYIVLEVETLGKFIKLA